MWLVYILIGLGVALALVCNYFYGLAVSNTRKPFLKGNKDLPEVFLGGIYTEGREWLEKVKKENITLKSHDGLTLQSFLIPSTKADQKVYVILAHGYTSKGMDMGAEAKFYNEEMDFNVLAPDTRGHGKSHGKYIGFGWHDRLDYLKWIEYLIETHGQDIKILLHGISMGGATVLMLSGEKLPPNVKAILSDCAYTSAYDILAYQLKRRYGLPPFPVLSLTSFITWLRAGYSFQEASALKQVKKASLPILFIHGKEDTFVPFTMVHKLYEVCASEKKLLEVEGAGHGEALIKDYEGYREAIKGFIRNYL